MGVLDSMPSIRPRPPGDALNAAHLLPCPRCGAVNAFNAPLCWACEAELTPLTAVSPVAAPSRSAHPAFGPTGRVPTAEYRAAADAAAASAPLRTATAQGHLRQAANDPHPSPAAPRATPRGRGERSGAIADAGTQRSERADASADEAELPSVLTALQGAEEKAGLRRRLALLVAFVLVAAALTAIGYFFLGAPVQVDVTAADLRRAAESAPVVATPLPPRAESDDARAAAILGLTGANGAAAQPRATVSPAPARTPTTAKRRAAAACDPATARLGRCPARKQP
jgi:hypothetical protein